MFSLSCLRYDYTFEIYSDSERLYLFGADSQEGVKEWVKSITKVALPTALLCFGVADTLA